MKKAELTYQQLQDENEGLKIKIQEQFLPYSILSSLKQGNLAASDNQIFKLIFETAKIGLAILDNQGNFIECNPRLSEITGYSREELCNLDFNKITHPDDKHLDTKYLSDCLAGNINSFSIEKRYFNKFGNTVWVNLMVNIIRDEKGEFIYAVSATEDITEQKKLKQVEDIILGFNQDFDNLGIDEILATCLQLAEELTDSELGFFHYIDEENSLINFKFWTEKTKKNFQLSDEIQSIAFSDSEVWAACIKEKKSMIFNNADNTSKKGGFLENYLSFKRIIITPLIENNKVSAIIGFGNKESDYKELDLKMINLIVNNVWGIVQRKKAELKLIESESNFRSFFDSIDNFLFVLDISKNILEINQSPIDFLGYTKKELIGENFSILIKNKNIADSDTILKGRNIKRNISLYSKRGRVIPVEITVTLGIWNKVEVFYAECKDISLLKYSETKFSKVFHINPAICAIIDAHTENFIELNKTFYHKLNYSPKDVIGKNSLELFKIDNTDKRFIYNQFYVNGRLNNYEISLPSKRGKNIPVLLSGELVTLQGKEYVYVVALDITNIKATQVKLKSSELRLQEAHRIAQIGHYNFNIDTGYWENSRSLDEIFAIDSGYIRDLKGWLNIIHPSFREELQDYLLNYILKEHNSFDKIYKIIGINDGHEKWVHGRGILKFDQSGMLVEMVGTIQDVTSQKKAEIKIEESELALKNIIKSTFGKSGQEFLDNMCLCLQQITMADYAYIAEKINENEISTLSFYHQQSKIENTRYNFTNTPCEKVFINQSIVFEHQVSKAIPDDNVFKELRINAYVGTPVFDHVGNPIGIIVLLFKNPIIDSGFINSMVEICSVSIGSEMERTKSELKIRESELTLKAVFNNEPSMMVLLNEKGNILNINKSGENIFNYNNPHILGIRNNGLMDCYIDGHSELDCGRPDECKNCLLRFIFKYTLKTGEPIIKLEAEIYSTEQKQSFVYTFLLSSSRIELDDNYKILISIDDITDRKRMEQKLLENEFTLNKIFNNAPTIMILIDQELKISKMNKTASEMSLFYNNESETITCGEVINCANLFNRPICDGKNSICRNCNISEIVHSTIHLGKEYFKEEVEIISLINKKMELRTFLISSSLINSGSKKWALLTLDEISDRKKIDEELILSKDNALFNEERYKLLSSITFEGIMLHKNQVIVDVNDALVIMSGYTYEELIGQHTIDLLFIPEHKTFLEQKLTEEYSEPYETVLLEKRGNRISVEIESRYFNYGIERIRVSAIRDITERKLGEKKILQAIVQTEENERARFAQDLHDGLGPILSNVQMYFQWLAEADNNVDFVIEKGNISLRNAFATLREISNNLSPHILHNFGITHALNNFFETIALRDIAFNFKTNIEKRRFDNNVEIALYRIITELINNSLKYSGASEIFIEMNLENGLLKTIYSDNGKGFDIKETLKNFKGFGMINIQNRIKAVHGNIDFFSDKDTGFRVEMGVKIIPK